MFCMITQAATILCVEPDDEIVGSRCEALATAGYSAVSASPELAKTILAQRKFDMIVTSGLSERELASIVRLANGAELLVLGRLTVPTVLLFLVDERLRQLRVAHASSPPIPEDKAERKPRPSFLARFL